MKKQLQLMLTVLFMVRFGFTTYAQQVGSEFAFNNITYQVTALGSTNTVTATGYNTAGGAVTIPQTVDHGPNTYTVTRIGYWAFANKGITSVAIANSVTTIDGGAFRDNQLLSVVLPGSLASIGNSAFRNNRLTSVTIPEGVTSIGSNAFNFNHLLNQVVVKATDPPSLVAANAFITRRDRIDLVVPIDALDAYMDPANGWTDFKSISGPAPFVTTWEVEAGGSITIPINGIHTNNFTYDFIVDWGDHMTTAIATSNPNDAALTHTYTDAGTYQVSISGNFPAIHFNNGGDKDKIRTVEQWGAIQWESMAGAFSGCSQLDIMATDAPDLQLVWDMRGMFAMSGITGQHTDLNSWDVSRASLMNSMFLRTSNFNGDIGDWDVSNVIDMELMFEEATTFNGEIGDWDVGNVTDMKSMFDKASAFNGDIGGWDVSNVTNMGWMFQGARTFNQDIGGWDVRNVTNMVIMFSSAHDFNQNIGGWDVSNVTNMRWMFGGAHTFNQDISDWNVGNVTNMEGMFSTAYDFNQDIGRWDVGNITTMAHMLNSSGLSVANYGATLAGWAALPNTPIGIPLGVDGLEYDQTGATHRQTLINDHG